uniref:Uncharacterized protein n=1 Tax=Panagrolaimus sp. JU765 TaxID=591449 RepID=A0AC34RMI0_9BILA
MTKYSHCILTSDGMLYICGSRYSDCDFENQNVTIILKTRPIECFHLNPEGGCDYVQTFLPDIFVVMFAFIVCFLKYVFPYLRKFFNREVQ